MRQKKFTLTELLVVIGVIMILAMIAFPAISSVRKKMQITKAKSDIASITAALQQVQSIYSNFRNLSSLVDANGMIDTTAHYQTLFEELIEPPASPVFNFRKIRMLDKRKNQYDTAGTYRGWLDPWGHEYKIYIDSDYDGDIEINGLTPTTSPPRERETKSVYVYSYGPDGADDNARYSAVVADGLDDITLDN